MNKRYVKLLGAVLCLLRWASLRVPSVRLAALGEVK